ncbi:PilN domain-containing protein [Ruegeria sp.]|uniref:PilN domain-containing protein n=1 Tax=Ruegeria sp. TaxID=1879320 RepID=UPI00231DB359|nr:PilN domain-containing protein [Ruegeria sp.]MDA7966146.1 PilN domain-containing protein [Ruegeria sp.]
MIGRTFGDVKAKLTGWAGSLVPEWAGAMFWGQPKAVPLRFRTSHLKRADDILSIDALSQETPRPGRGEDIAVIDVLAPAEFFFERRLTLPPSARGKLEEMSLLDLRSRTPFELNNIYWRLGKPIVRGDAIEVSQWIVRREDVAGWKRNLKKNGFRVRKLYVDNENAPTAIADFSDEILPGRQSFRRLNAALVSVAALALLTAWLYPGWAARSETRALQLELETLRSEALLERRKVEDIRKAEAQKAAFVDAVLLRPLLLDTVRELTVSLEDDIWVSTLTFTTSRVVLTGEAGKSAAETVLSLGKRSGFGNPRLSGPVSRTARGSERFEITLDLGATG